MLISPAGRALATFWLALGLVYLLPGPLGELLRSPEPLSVGQSAAPGAPPPRAEAPTLAGAGPKEPEKRAAAAGSAEAARAEPAVHPFEDPKQALAPFFTALERTRQKQPGAITRVLHYGDSLIDMDRITGPLRRRLQRRYGDGGHGFVLAGKPWRWYSQKGVTVSQSKAWEVKRLVGGRAGDGRLGLGCAALQLDRGRGWTQYNLAPEATGRSLELHYLARPRGGSLSVEAGEKTLATVQTAAETVRSGFSRVALPEGARVLRIKARGPLRLFGLRLGRPGPGIVWSNLPLVAARFHQLALLDESHWAEQLKQVAPHLVVFQFGANDTVSYGGDLGRYKRRVALVLSRLKAALPRAGCLVIGPLDRLQRGARGELHSPEVVRTVSAAQREVALSGGCAFWDGQAAMGGPGSMARWVKQKMARKDMVHLNRKGSKRMATLLDGALEQAFAAHRRAAAPR